MFLQLSDFFKYLILGIVQGVTEPLPISSSGHVVIFRDIFSVDIIDNMNFNTIVNFGSLLAIMFFYRAFLKEIITGAYQFVFKKDKDKKADFLYIIYMFIATIPAGIAGLIFKNTINTHLTSLLSVGISLFITGIILVFIHHRAKTATIDKISLKTAIAMGCAQILALIPGITRSGTTTAAGVITNVDLKKALRFSFMMFIPISLASLVLGLYEINAQTVEIHLSGYIVAFIMSFLGTFYAIHFFFKLVRNNNLIYFAYYCFTVSMTVLLYLAITK